MKNLKLFEEFATDLDYYTAEEDLSINGALGKYKVKQGDLLSINWRGKMPGHCTVMMPGKLAELNKSMLEELIENGKLKSTDPE